MHVAADAVAGESAYHAVAVGFGIGLNRIADIVERCACPEALYRLEEALLGDLYQPPLLFGHVSDEESAGGVAVEAVLFGGDVYADDIAVDEYNVVRGDAVHHHIVYLNAGAGGETLVAEAGGIRAAGSYVPVYEVVDLLGGHARLYVFAYEI